MFEAQAGQFSAYKSNPSPPSKRGIEVLLDLDAMRGIGDTKALPEQWQLRYHRAVDRALPKALRVLPELHALQVLSHYIIQPLAELYRDCMVVLKVS